MFEPNAPRIMIWKFEDAPAVWRALYDRSTLPEWVAFIPATLGGADLEAEIRNRFANTTLSFHETESGDQVIIGVSALRAVFELIAEYQAMR